MDWLMEDILRIGTVTVICAAVAASMFVFSSGLRKKPDIPGIMIKMAENWRLYSCRFVNMLQNY